MPLDILPNQEFLEFISKQDGKKGLPNLELILNLEENYPGMFIKVMSNFDMVKKKRIKIVNGKEVARSWKDSMILVYRDVKYIGIKEENKDIAELCGARGLSQEMFDELCNLRVEQKKSGVPEHLLGKQIKEETILESIEKIKNETETELINGKEMIERLYEKKFTYDWLNKNDAHNGILGLFCSCCGTITSFFYGSKIAKASIIASDVQNIVIRDSKGEIISKGTMYLNKERGYAVINDFELNEKYRHHESSSGKYNVEETSPEEQDREMIFKTFQRGLRAFIEEYNRQNRENPLKQINVGMGYNRLKRQVKRFKKATLNLTVPAEYGFEDAKKEQYILYEREKENENEGEDR